jgi:hypothetical protein
MKKISLLGTAVAAAVLAGAFYAQGKEQSNRQC